MIQTVLKLASTIALLALAAFVANGFLYLMLSRDIPSCDPGSFYSYREHTCIRGH